MAVCPKGHESETTDYCDECGAAMTPSAGAPSPAAPAASPSPSSPSSSPSSAAARPAVCPECGTPMTGRFCEVDGFDALAVPSPVAVPSPPSAAPEPVAVPAPPSAAPEPVGVPAPPSVAPAPPVVPAPAGAAAVAGWHVEVTADRAFFDRVQAWNGPDPAISYPPFCPVRRFPLTGDQVLIGRRSRSRGSYPDIDLAGPPEDIAVSHLHALLVAQPGGGWAVVDLRSANCTFVNGADDPIQPELPVPLADGDHLHVGSFTRITLHATPL